MYPITLCIEENVHSHVLCETLNVNISCKCYQISSIIFYGYQALTVKSIRFHVILNYSEDMSVS